VFHFRWSVIPVLNHINTASEVPLVEANILRLRERNIIPHVLKKLQPLSPEYGHLKRVKNGQLLINIGNENELPDLIWLKELLNEEPEIITCKVPRLLNALMIILTFSFSFVDKNH
jgi:hypothetical protein